jgi:hypothetical protein
MYTPYVYKPSHKPRNLEEEQAEQQELKLRAWAEGVVERTRKAMKELWLEECRAACRDGRSCSSGRLAGRSFAIVGHRLLDGWLKFKTDSEIL